MDNRKFGKLVKKSTTKRVSHKHMDHGECAVCHKKGPLVKLANVCEDCLNVLIDETKGV